MWQCYNYKTEEHFVQGSIRGWAEHDNTDTLPKKSVMCLIYQELADGGPTKLNWSAISFS